MHPKKWESVETRYAQTTTLSYPFSVRHKLHRLKRGIDQKQNQKQRQTTANRKRKSIGIECFSVAVAFDFNAVPLLTLPIVLDRNGKKRVRCLSVTSF